MNYLLLVGFALLVPANAGFPDYLSAVRYDLHFTFNPSINLDTFNGVVNITLKTSKTTGNDINYLVLNGYNLEMSDISLVYPSSRRVIIKPQSVVVDTKEQTIRFPIPETLLPSQEYSLRIVYSGKINDDVGLVKTKSGDSNYLVTVLYPAYARRMYPCIDQPNMRAIYKVTIVVNYNGIPPTIVSGLKKIDDSKTDKKNYKLVVTYDSNNMPLPPYSITFTIGSYRTVSQNLIVPSNMKDSSICMNAINALKAKTIDSLIRAANIASLSLVFVPGLPIESVSGYGITAISQELGTEVIASSTSALKYQGIAILSGLFKSIYGSVISPASWSDIWISESIPLYISNAVFSQLPRWEDWKNIGVIDVQQAALDGTWSESSLPVKPDSFASVDDVLKYLASPAVYKGAAIIRMMETIQDSSPVINAFINLVKEKSGKVVSTDELLDKYEEYNQLSASLPDKKKLKDVLNPWLKQTGFPAISVLRKSRDIVASQSRFGPNQKTMSSWIVPIIYSLNNVSIGNTLVKWLNSGPNTELQLATNVKADDFVTVNNKGPGLYRVLYNEQDVLLVQKQLEKDVNYFTPEFRASIISDGLAFARVGGQRYSITLNMMSYLKNERSLAPWIAASNGLKEMWPLLYFTDLKTQFENYATALLRYSYSDSYIGGLGLDDTSFMKGHLRRLIVSQLCDYGDVNCRDDTKAAFTSYIISNKENEIAAKNLLPVIYCNGLRELKGAKDILNYLSRKYVSSAPQDVRRNVFSYLACAKENDTREGLINALLLKGIPSVHVLPEDIVLAFDEIVRRPEQIVFLLNFFVKNYEKLHPSLKEEHKAQMVQAIGQVASTADHSKILRDLKCDSPLVKGAVTQALASIQSRQSFLSTNYEEIKKGLYGHSPAPTSSPKPTTVPPTGTASTPHTTSKPTGAAAVPIATISLILTAVAILFVTH